MDHPTSLIRFHVAQVDYEDHYLKKYSPNFLIVGLLGNGRILRKSLSAHAWTRVGSY
jgi:hypothetical protein